MEREYSCQLKKVAHSMAMSVLYCMSCSGHHELGKRVPSRLGQLILRIKCFFQPLAPLLTLIASVFTIYLICVDLHKSLMMVL